MISLHFWLKSASSGTFVITAYVDKDTKSFTILLIPKSQILENVTKNREIKKLCDDNKTKYGSTKKMN